jgi:hypothetical protein
MSDFPFNLPWAHAGSLDLGWVLPPLDDAVNTFLAAGNLHCDRNGCRIWS